MSLSLHRPDLLDRALADPGSLESATFLLPDDDRPEDCGCARCVEETQALEARGARVLAGRPGSFGNPLEVDQPDCDPDAHLERIAEDRELVVAERAGLDDTPLRYSPRTSRPRTARLAPEAEGNGGWHWFGTPWGMP